MMAALIVISLLKGIAVDGVVTSKAVNGLFRSAPHRQRAIGVAERGIE